MPKRKQPATKTMEDESEKQEAKEVEPKLKQTKKTTKDAEEKPAAKETKTTRGKSKENGTMEEEKTKTTPKKETPKKETPKKETPKKDKIEEEKEKPAAKGRGRSKKNEKSDTDEEEEEEETEKPTKKVVNTKKGAKAKEEEKEESPAKGKRGRSKKGDKEVEEKKEGEDKEEPKKKGRGKSKASEEKVIVKKVSGGEDGEGETTVTATIPKNPKKLNRNRSSLEDALDNYEHNTRAIALGDGKIESKEILISSWNVNGLSALLKKENLHNYMKEVQPEIICLNEIKLTDANCEEIGTKWIPEGYHGYFNCCKVKKGYAGVAVVSKHKPISVKFDLGVKKHDLEGRTITVEFEHFYLVSCYVPNAGDGLVGLPYRTQEWDPDFRAYLADLKQKKHVILCGDLNCAHKEIDLHKPKGNEKTAGFTPEERKEFGVLLDSGFVDTFRHFYPEEQKFSYFSLRFNNRATNKGWRLDYFLIDKEGMSSVKDSTINDKIFGSDHLPIELKFNPNFDS